MRIRCQSIRIEEFSAGRRPAIPGESLGAVAGHRADDAGGPIHFPNDFGDGVRDINVSGSIDSDPGGPHQIGAVGRPTVSTVSIEVIAGEEIDICIRQGKGLGGCY